MLVSVIIPCFKNSSTLSEAIDSVLAQSYPVNEIIVVNDCSPETPEINSIINSYPSVRYVVNSRNIGLAASRNVGANLSTSELLSFLDADDLLHPQKIELQCSIYTPGIAVSCNNLRFKNISDIVLPSFSHKFVLQYFYKSYCFLFGNKVTGASLLIAKSDFISQRGYDETLKSCEDFDLSLRLLSQQVTIANINLPLYYYRESPNSLSNSLQGILKWQLTVLKKIFVICFPPCLIIFIDYIIAFWILKHVSRCENVILSSDVQLIF